MSNLTCNIKHGFYVHGPVHRESMSIIVQQDKNMYNFIRFSADSSKCFG